MSENIIRISTFARRVSKQLRAMQKYLLREFLNKVAFNINDLETTKEIVLEIGFGNGEFLASEAMKNPDKLFIGAEPYLNGVASLLKEIKAQELKNIRVFADDARLILDRVDKATFSRINIICPDPWQKRKQHQRRLIQKDFIISILKTITTGGELLIVTDHQEYACWIHKILLELKLIEQPLEQFLELPINWIYSKYQKMGISKGSNIYYFAIKHGGL